jgi:CMP-N-acetylneuraminic acid synthetase
MRFDVVGIIPARQNSLRVPNKSLLVCNNHPIIAYSIIEAIESKLFKSVIVASDSEKICEVAEYYGADEVVKRSEKDATSTSQDIEWLTNLFDLGVINSDHFSILRPTSPLRSKKLMEECLNTFRESGADSLRTIAKVKEHPGKMWYLKEESKIIPYLKQNKNEIATHAQQYQSLSEVYIQTSVMEIAKTSVINETGTREGNHVIGYLTQGLQTHAIDTIDDYLFLEYLISKNINVLPKITKEPYEFTK